MSLKRNKKNNLTGTLIFAVLLIAFLTTTFVVSTSVVNGNFAYAVAGTETVYWDPVFGNDMNDGLTSDAPKLSYDGFLSVIGDGASVGVVKMVGNALTATTDTTLSGQTTSGNITLGRDEAYDGNIFIVSNNKNLVLQNMNMPSSSKVAVTVKSNATLWLKNVSFGVNDNDIISLEGGYLSFVEASDNSYVLASSKVD